MKRPGERLLAVHPDGQWEWVENTYEGIKHGLRGATMDFMGAGGPVGLYIDDEGLLNSSPLNVPVSMFLGVSVYGSAVLCAGMPDDDGDTVMAPEEASEFLARFATQWANVCEDARRKGQDPLGSRGRADTIPPAVIVGFSDDEEMQRFLDLDTEERPDD